MEDQMNQRLLSIEADDDYQETSHQNRILTEDLKVFTYDELKCATLGFGYKTCLGEWSFGKVYKGWVDEMTFSPTEQGTGLAIVTKTFQDHHSEIIKSKLDLVLRKLNHPNLVKLIGYCFEGELLFLVEEFYYGNFEDCLRYGAISRLPLDTKAKMALGIARAIIYLQQTQHQIASNRSFADHSFEFERCNILLDEDFTAKLSDYNVSSFRPWPLEGLDCDIDHPAHNPPPSILGWNNITSFTMVLAEILTGEPVSDTNPLVAMNHLRHSKDILKDPKSLGSIANRCFEICNDVDSEAKMLRLLKKFEKNIPT
ncbi:hypothetical protein QVD17_27601 [Tagetes erecta]|uniref:Protein kinase domain-containing protein n=1 Tax=Tagetes erecta TaxID=13708 RepID=A0AAD8NRV0_TARER|nr:hypothetical protein QVD17_27601 [Tagetes erecta]